MSALNLNKYALKSGLVRMPLTNNSHYQNTNIMNNSNGSVNKGKNNPGIDNVSSNPNSQSQSQRNIPSSLLSQSIQMVSPLASSRNQERKKTTIATDNSAQS